MRHLTVNAYTRKARTDSGICLSFGGQTSGNTTGKNLLSFVIRKDILNVGVSGSLFILLILNVDSD